MRKKLIAVAFAAGLLGTIGMSGPAHARCDQGGPRAGHNEQAEVPVTGSHIYGSDPGGTSGYIGIHGSTGYLEADGNATDPSGSIQGGSNDGTVNGKISGDADGITVCVNDTTLP